MSINYTTIDSILETATFFCNADNPKEVFVKWSYNGHLEITPMTDLRFQAFLSEQYRLKEGLEYAPNVKPTLKKYKHQAILNGKTESLHHRTAGTASHMEYFLANSDRQRISVSPDGWELSATGQYNFLFPSTMRSQVLPARTGNLDLLDKYVNLTEKDLWLFKFHLLQLFFDHSTHFAMVLNSSKGTGKSTLSRVISELVDPCVVAICAAPKKFSDFENLLVNRKLCVLDNTAILNEEFSNLLAGAITGTTVSKRTLYHDYEQSTAKLKTALVINGIDIVSPKSDMLQRSLCYELEKIPPDKRMTDDEFWSSFQNDKAAILGGIFDTIAKAMEELRKGLTLRKLPRMADAYTDMAAIALAMGMNTEDFERFFHDNVGELQRRFAETNCVVESVLACMATDDKRELKGPAGKIYERLKHTSYGRSTTFPGSSSAFTRWLNDEGEDVLNAVGLTYSHKKKHDYTELTIRKKR